MQNEIFFGFLIWGLKEVYQSFIGSRKKAQESLDKINREVLELQVKLENATVKIEELNGSVLRLAVDRVYRSKSDQ